MMVGRQPHGREQPAANELMCLACPRRVYTQSYADDLCEVILHVHGKRDACAGRGMG